MAASCNKGKTPAPVGPPTDLALTAAVSIDNSGNVTFLNLGTVAGRT